jgi:hypothetical protein
LKLLVKTNIIVIIKTCKESLFSQFFKEEVLWTYVFRVTLKDKLTRILKQSYILS